MGRCLHDIAATPDEGYAFTGWTSTGYGTFEDANRASTTFAMPANNTTITAHFEPIPITYSLTGRVRSYNPNIPTTIQLMQDGEEVYSASIPAESGSGQQTQEFTFPGVAPGTYTLVITKPGHTSFTVQTVVVGNEDLDLTKDIRPEVQLMALRCGDLNGDGVIDDRDLTILWL